MSYVSNTENSAQRRVFTVPVVLKFGAIEEIEAWEKLRWLDNHCLLASWFPKQDCFGDKDALQEESGKKSEAHKVSFSNVAKSHSQTVVLTQERTAMRYQSVRELHLLRQ